MLALAHQNENNSPFEQFKCMLKKELGARVYNAWFAAMQFAGFSDGIVTITVPEVRNGFIAKHINETYQNDVLWYAAKAWVGVKHVLVKTRSMVLKTYNQRESEVHKERKIQAQPAAAKVILLKKPLDIDGIKKCVSDFCHIRPSGLDKPDPKYYRAQGMAIYFAETHLLLSHQDIGAAFGLDSGHVETVLNQVAVALCDEKESLKSDVVRIFEKMEKLFQIDLT